VIGASYQQKKRLARLLVRSCQEMETIPWADGGKKREKWKTDGKRRDDSGQKLLSALHFARKNRQ